MLCVCVCCFLYLSERLIIGDMATDCHRHEKKGKPCIKDDGDVTDILTRTLCLSLLTADGLRDLQADGGRCSMFIGLMA